MDYDGLDRRTYLKATAGVVSTSVAGCLDLDIEERGRPTEATVEELLEDPGRYEDEIVRTSGHARYAGDRTYVVPMFDPATEMVHPQPVKRPTYELAADKGDDETLSVHASAIHPAVDDLEVDEWYEQEVRASGTIIEAEHQGSDETVYLLDEATVGPN